MPRIYTNSQCRKSLALHPSLQSLQQLYIYHKMRRVQYNYRVVQTLTVIFGCVWRLVDHSQVGALCPQYTAGFSKVLVVCCIGQSTTNTTLTLVSTSVHSMLLSHELLLVSLMLEWELLELLALRFLLASLMDLLGRGRGVCGLECFKTSTSVNWTAVPPPRVRKISP